jgi:cytochrome c biogenesis protein CcmG/thiol:disulfide interchange protein DsbE
MKRLLAIAFLTALIVSPLAADLITSVERQVAPDVTVREADGSALRLSSLRGQVILLNFWATWCVNCKVEMPWFSDFQASYESKGLSVIGVAMDADGWKSVGPYLKEHPLGYRVVTGDTDVTKPYALIGFPVTLLIDRNGKIAARHDGLVDRAAVESEIQNLLQERR